MQAQLRGRVAQMLGLRHLRSCVTRGSCQFLFQPVPRNAGRTTGSARGTGVPPAERHGQDGNGNSFPVAAILSSIIQNS